MQKTNKKSMFDRSLFKSKIRSANVKFPEMLFGYFIGPFGALLASGIFTSFLNRYWTDVLFVNYKVGGVLPQNITTFLSLLPLISAVLIVVGNLVAGQLIERTRTSAGKARPWILLSSILLSIFMLFPPYLVMPKAAQASSPKRSIIPLFHSAMYAAKTAFCSSVR